MKFVILLLLSCCAVALARPDSSAEHSDGSSSKSDKHGSQDSGKNESQTSSSSANSNKDGNKKKTPLALTVIIDRVIMLVTKSLGIPGINSGEDLIATLTDNPIGKIIWSMIIPVVSDVNTLQDVIDKTMSWIDFFISFVIPFPIRNVLYIVFKVITFIISAVNRLLVSGIKVLT